jgi:hypothetical protein
MDNTVWAIEGTTGAFVEIQGRRFTRQDSGAPHLCHMVCAQQGRHVHIDYCADKNDIHEGNEALHIDVPMLPNPGRAKDWISHALFWKRIGE